MARADSNQASRQQLTLILYTGDEELVAFIREFLGVGSNSEAIRSSIRAYAMHLQTIGKR